MRILRKDNIEEIAKVLKMGELVCSPTDTLFGILGNALNEETIKKLYLIKKRDKNKPLIVLFDSVDCMEEYGIVVPEKFKEGLKKLYPASVTTILPLDKKSPFREVFERNDIAVRVPDDPFLRELIKKTFPLFAPSANPQGMEPAKSCEECRRYFENLINYCIEGKSLELPSTIVDLTGNFPRLVREGVVDFSKVVEVLSGKKT
ncbi:MAG: L-threonylcarbamoyladenylate synthase [Desulfurobacteriaceae bacterium]